MIPDQLTSEVPTFIKLARGSKAPKRGNSAKDGPFYHASDSAIASHLGHGGNLGRVLRDDLVAFDVDDQKLADVLKSNLPPTFVIESGGGGFGEHWYYRCPPWDENQIELTAEQRNLGSLRSGNSYCLAPPSKHDETGDEYQVKSDRQISAVSVAALHQVLERYQSANTGGGGGRRRRPAGVGGSGASAPLPDEYPANEVSWSVCRKWLKSNDLLDRLNQTTSGDWSGDEFALAKCLAEGGFHPDSIRDALDRLNHRSKWHNRESNYQRLTVQKAIEAACNDPYVEFSSTADMDGNTSERRKTESGGTSPGNHGGDTNMDYTTKQNLTVYNADSPEDAEDGDRVVRVELTNMKGTGDDGEPVDTDFVTITKGTLKENGDFGVAPEFPGQSKSVGQADPDDLRLIADGLKELADELED